MLRDTAYYDNESARYEQERYPDVSTMYTHFLFKRRLFLARDILQRLFSAIQTPNILEIGCATGVVLRTVRDLFPGAQLTGVDLSPKMVEQAKRFNPRSMRFFVRGEETGTEPYDLVLEVGVLNTDYLRKDLAYVASCLIPNGYFLCSLAGRRSCFAFWKGKQNRYVQAYLTYGEYEAILKEEFTIIEQHSYGFFVPKLWSCPFVARFLQPVFDYCFTPFPEFFHETLYLLQKRD